MLGRGFKSHTAIMPTAMEACHTLNHHRGEQQVHEHQGRPEVQFTQRFIHKSPRYLWIPVINTGEETEDTTRSNHVVEVTNDVVSVMQEKVDHVEGQRQTRKTTDTEHREER